MEKMENIAEKILEQQTNDLSSNLQRIYKMEEIFYPLIHLIVSITIVAIVCSILNPNPVAVVIVYTIAIGVSFINYIKGHMQRRSFPKTIFYTPKGIHWITHGGKKVFIPWEYAIKVKPIGDYGRILGYGNGKVPDYAFFYKKPFPGNVPVSAEVAEKIRKYMAKYNAERIELHMGEYEG